MRVFCLLSLLLLNHALVWADDQMMLDSLKVQLNYADRDEDKIKTLWALSDHYWADDIRMAIQYSEQALELAKKLGDTYLEGISYEKIGNTLLLSGDNSNSLKNYLKSLQLLEPLQEEEALFSLYHNLGVLFDRMADYNKALLYYEKALFIYNNSKKNLCYTMAQVHSLYNSIGNIYAEKADRQRAEEYYRKAMALALKSGDHQALGVIYNNLGKQAIESNQMDSAYLYYQRSLESRVKINDLNGMAKSYNSLCNYFNTIGDQFNSLRCAQKALQLSEASGARSTRLTSLNFLSSIYEKQGDAPMALDYYKRFKQLSDSLINESSIKKQTELQVAYEYEKQVKVKEAESQRKNLLFILVISLLLLGLVIVLLLYHLSKNRSKRIILEKKSLEQDLVLRNKDIAAKDKELASSVLYLLAKNDLLNDVSERLLTLKKKITPEHHNAIQKIIFDIQDGSREDMWDEFEMRFQQVHDDYYRKLKEQGPDLTPGELKICTFLKLNMSSKEISAITRQSVKSIEVTRTRIRKKMQLTNQEVNLVSFLMEL
ncbi:MAG: tetratricopeptide repeat protein [Breznakibacter sp.]